MRFTEVSARAGYANMVVHDLRFPPKVFALADVLAARMRKMNGGRLWMGAHMRRGDCKHIFPQTNNNPPLILKHVIVISEHWLQASPAKAHIESVKEHLEIGRGVLTSLGNISTYALEGAKPDMEQITLPPPLRDDMFYVATDERDPEALKVISDTGAIFFSALLTNEDRRAFGWPLMITDVRAIVEQAVLAHSAYFYGNSLSSLAGAIVNLRAARGADPRTIALDRH